MDDNDIKIILLFIVNSRLSYREIADYLGLSVNAVYKRVQNLIDLGIIKKFRAGIKPYAINAIFAFIFGQSDSQNMDNIVNELSKHENTYNIILSSRNYLYIGSLLKDIHQLDEYSSFVSQTASIKTPQIGLLHGVFYHSPLAYITPRSRTMSMDELDISIIRSLHNDSRKPISEIADDVNSTSNTVRRRLNRLIEEGIIDLTIEFNPNSSNDIFTLIQLNTAPSVDKQELAQYLTEKYKPNIFFIWSFSNMPNFLLCYLWTNTMGQMNNVVESLKKEKINTVIPDIVYKGIYFDTWKEKMLYP